MSAFAPRKHVLSRSERRQYAEVILRGVLTWAAALGLGALLLYRISVSIVDPDLWHEMAVAREAVQTGRVPWEDRFAYTPTVFPVVHHEWGAGMIALGLANVGGGAAVVAAKFLLAFGLGFIGWRATRGRGATLAIFSFLAPMAILLADHGFSTIRAQVYSFLFFACLLFWLDRDREGTRRWIAGWLILYVLWLNIHAGFLVGAGVFFLAWLERLVRREPHRHLLVTGIAMACLIAVNPYGLEYYNYLWRATTMSRPLVGEWSSLWEGGHVVHIAFFAVSLLVLAYALWDRRDRVPAHLLIVLVTCGYAALHRRMLPFYAIAWLWYAPAAIRTTRLGDAMEEMWSNRQTLMTAIWGTIAIALAVRVLPNEPWSLRVPGAAVPGIASHAVYPVGAVDYLAAQRFRGDLVTPYDQGAYVSWRLYPAVRVSLDSRFEVAYPDEAAAENHLLYHGEAGWEEVLDRHGGDAILVPRWSPLDHRLQERPTSHPRRAATTWRPVYRDDVFSLFVAGCAADDLPCVDRTGERIAGSFP
jgi:hypothetical protein